MKKVYITKPGQREPIPTSEETLRTLWEQGLLSDDLLYWHSDRKRWVRLSDRFRREDPSDHFRREDTPASTNRLYPACIPEQHPAFGVPLPHRRPDRRFSLREPGRHPLPPFPPEESNPLPPEGLAGESPLGRSHLALTHYLLTAVLTVLVLGMLAGGLSADYRWAAILLTSAVSAYIAGVFVAGLLVSRYRKLPSRRWSLGFRCRSSGGKTSNVRL